MNEEAPTPVDALQVGEALMVSRDPALRIRIVTTVGDAVNEEELELSEDVVSFELVDTVTSAFIGRLGGEGGEAR